MSSQREEEDAALLACVRSNATRDSQKVGLMPFEIARPGHRISVASQECGERRTYVVRYSSPREFGMFSSSSHV